MPWKRPDDVPYPYIWRRVQRKWKDGRTLLFRVQDVTPDLHDAIIDHMTKYFLVDAPTCRSAKITEEKASVDDFHRMWRKGFESKVGLVLLLEDENGDVVKEDQPDLPKIAGINMTAISCKGDPEPELNGKHAQFMCKALYEVVNQIVNVFDYYDIDKFMSSLGLSVDPVYRGYSLGGELLKSRIPLCKAVGIPATMSIFTPISSQLLAERAGFETIAQIAYEDNIIDGKVAFPDMEAKYMKVQALKIPE